MLTYVLGPFLSILPKAWRKVLPFSRAFDWQRATAVSGLGEALAALIALSYWYQSNMSTMIANGVDYALAGKSGPEVSPQAIGSVALVIFVSHPLTWVLAYFGLEGVFRLCAGAFGETAVGVLPLFLLDNILFSSFRRGEPDLAIKGQRSPGVSSVAGALSERLHAATSPQLRDEVRITATKPEEVLEIRASRRKDDWTPPRVVRYRDSYYRLESESAGGGTRPYRYLLRRLPAGVPGRSVLIYAPENEIVLTPH
jgi:hypothetical protein